MSENKVDVAELRGLLEKATPGDWRVVGPDPTTTNPNMGRWDVEGRTNVANTCTYADATLIADVKRALPSLLDQLKQSQRERAEARDIVADCNNSLFGSQGYFVKCGETTQADAIERLKEHGTRQWQRAEASQSRVAELTAVCAKQEETIHQNDAERDASEARVARLRGALDLCMTGGNHIASLLVAKLGPGFSEMLPPDTDHDIALHRLCATDEYDMWCCWAAIMRARDQALQEGE